MFRLSHKPFVPPLQSTAHLPLLLQKSPHRWYSMPLVKTYTPIISPISLWWHQKVPVSAKYAFSLIATAVCITHIHPNTLITAGPPCLAAAYFLYRRLKHMQYRTLLNLVKSGETGEIFQKNIVRIRKYDPADKKNVLEGIETEFDSFRSQTIPIIRSKLLEYVMEQDRTGLKSATFERFLDENKQVVVYIETDPETFVKLKAEGGENGEIFLRFITFSVPYYTSRNVKERERLGTLQVSMLAEAGENNEIVENDDERGDEKYILALQAWPYRMFSRPERIC